MNNLYIFAGRARVKDFRAATNNLKLAAGSVSESIQRIESSLGVRLIERTTRKMSLTSAGEKLLQRTLPALVNLESALHDLNEEGDSISGTLRL